MDIQTIRKALADYVQNVTKYVHVDSVLLYGSVSKREHAETSDVDLLVLSRDFSSMDPDDRSKLLYRASVGFPYDLHVYGVTPKEFESASSLTTLGQIRRGPVVRIV